MNYCKKCGSELKENAKFCSVCGNPVDLNHEEINLSMEETYEPIKPEKETKSKFKLILIFIVLVLLFSGAAGAAYFKMSSTNKEQMIKSIEILGVDIEKYPEITISIKINNYDNKLYSKNFTIKENDAFQKDLNLSDGVEKNQYKITYKTSDEATSSEKKMKVACELEDKEYIADYAYTPPAKKQSGNEKSNSNNSVNTYDDNEVKVKAAIENYENAYIRMINTKNIDYIKNSIDLSGGLINEFTSLIKSYSDQGITEDLINHKIEDIKKISDSDYEVVVTEKYYISYAKEKKSTYSDFKDTYEVKLTSSGFKVYAIKNVTSLGNKQNP